MDWQGVFANTGGNWSISNATVRRNGASAASGSVDNCQFRVEGSGSLLQLSSVITKSGADDDGGGTVTPEYTIIYTGGSTAITSIISNSSLSGSTISAIRSIVVPATRKYANNIGVYDVSTEGYTQINNGRRILGPNISNGSLAAQGTLTFTLTPTASGLGTYARPVTATIVFQARNDTLTTAESYFLVVRISRVSTGDAVITALGAGVGSATTWGMSSASPTGVSISLSISADASLITGTLTGIDSSARFIDISLKD